MPLLGGAAFAYSAILAEQFEAAVIRRLRDTCARQGIPQCRHLSE